MTAPDRDARARRLSALLCVALVVGLAWGLHRLTAGFEVWTFEGLRQLRLQSGALRAAPVQLLAAPVHPLAAPVQPLAAAAPPGAATGALPTLWRADDSGPAAYLVDFIYTRCPSVCRALGSEYQQMQRDLAERHRQDPALVAVRLVSISFDVAHDTPARLSQFAGKLGADPRWWTFAVPASADDAQALLRSLGVVVVADGQDGFVHNGSIHLLDARGTLRGLYELEQWPQALADARRLTVQRLGGSQ